MIRAVVTERSEVLLAEAQRVADALPAEVVEEVVVTGSVSRGVADELSDIEMLIVTPEPLELTACFEHARAAGLEELDTWGPQGGPAQRVFGYREGVPIELVWWSRQHADSTVDAIHAGGPASSAEAIANGIALRTTGSLSRWQARLDDYPDELAAAQIEAAALTWGGDAPAGMLTVARPGAGAAPAGRGGRPARAERMVDDASRVLQIVSALTRVWLPTSKRLAARLEPLAVKPERLAERLQDAGAGAGPARGP